jgi:hypothetical protein
MLQAVLPAACYNGQDGSLVIAELLLTEKNEGQHPSLGNYQHTPRQGYH